MAIESVRRAVSVLEALSTRRSGTLAELCAATDLPPPTVHRMLGSLIALGYASRISRADGYRITNRVLGLSAGVRFVDRLVDAATRPMQDFTRIERWPLYLGTISAGAIAIRYSTAPLSPLSFESTGYDRRFNILASAIGRAYLAFCADGERAAILRDLADIDGPHMQQLHRRSELDRDLFAIRNLGFAGTRSTRPGRLHGVAVPILLGGAALAGLSLRYTTSAMSENEAASRFVPRLQRLARQIASKIDQDSRTNLIGDPARAVKAAGEKRKPR